MKSKYVLHSIVYTDNTFYGTYIDENVVLTFNT